MHPFMSFPFTDAFTSVRMTLIYISSLNYSSWEIQTQSYNKDYYILYHQSIAHQQNYKFQVIGNSCYGKTSLGRFLKNKLFFFLNKMDCSQSLPRCVLSINAMHYSSREIHEINRCRSSLSVGIKCEQVERQACMHTLVE